MKYIKNEISSLNKLVPSENGDKPKVEKLNYAELVIMILGSDKGLTAAEQRKRFKIMDDVESQLSEPYLKLEDAQWEEIKKLESVFKWGNTDREIVKFEDAVLNPLNEIPETIDVLI